MPVSVAFTYNGSNTVVATLTGVTNGNSYCMAVEDGNTYPTVSGTASGTSMTLTVSTAAPSAGYIFDVFVATGTNPYLTAKDFLGATNFQQGSTSEYSFPAVWSYDGVKTITVTGAFPNGIGMFLQLQDSVNGGSSASFTGTGASQLVSVTTTSTPGGAYFLGQVFAGSGGGFQTYTTRLFTSAVADAGVAGNPGSDPSPPPSSSGGVRVGIAFNDTTLEPTPTWTYLTDTANLVASYEINRGRQFEFDRTDTGTATVRINDRDGVLDPTNSTGPYYTLIEPLLQIQLELWNPITEDYHVRFRGFIEDFDYVVAPFTHQQGTDTFGVTFLEISCVDLFEILTAIEMQPGQFGDTPPAGGEGNVFFDNAAASDRIAQVLTDAGPIDSAFYVVFSLNVNMQESTYSPSENVLQVIQDAADAEFPTVSNVYVDRFGRLAVHGRLAKFDPDGTASDAGPDAWDYHHWKAGDGKAVALSPTDTAHFREFAFNRGLSKVFNSALCTPTGIDDPPPTPTTSDIPGQLYTDPTSIGIFGIRSWSAENLFIGALTGDPIHAANAGILTGNSALEECLLFATFIVENYKTPRNRISNLTFKSMAPDAEGAAANWDLLTKVDISDAIDVTITNPGEGGFTLEPGFVEGVHETATPLNGQYAFVTTNLDVSPRAYFDNPEGLDGL